MARLAGLPVEVLGRAREILLNLEKGEFSSEGMPKLAQTKKGSGQLEAQLPLFGQKDQLREEIKALNIDNLTPVQALMKLEELKRLV